MAAILNDVGQQGVANCEFVRTLDLVVVENHRPIAVGEQLIIDYGTDYWPPGRRPAGPPELWEDRRRRPLLS